MQLAKAVAVLQVVVQGPRRSTDLRLQGPGHSTDLAHMRRNCRLSTAGLAEGLCPVIVLLLDIFQISESMSMVEYRMGVRGRFFAKSENAMSLDESGPIGIYVYPIKAASIA